MILECLERSKLQEGVGKQFSGAGFVHRSRSALPDHLLHIYQSVDAVAAESIARSSTDIFPIRRVFNLGKEYQSVWAKKQFVRRGRDEVAAKEGAPSGPFPYVDERAAVLRELTKAEIYKTRHRVNSDAHPKWALRTIRRRRRKALIRAKKRSISQESIRILQAKLLASQTRG